MLLLIQLFKRKKNIALPGFTMILCVGSNFLVHRVNIFHCLHFWRKRVLKDTAEKCPLDFFPFLSSTVP